MILDIKVTRAESPNPRTIVSVVDGKVSKPVCYFNKNSEEVMRRANVDDAMFHEVVKALGNLGMLK
jgi:hypothetical protein